MSGSLFREPINAMPQVWYTGTKDASRGNVPLQPEARPVHFAWFPAYMEKGPTEPQMVVGAAQEALYGKKFLDARSKFATPVIPFINRCNIHGNVPMLQRIIPGSLLINPTDRDRPYTEEEAVRRATARICLCLDVEEATDIPQYERDASGNVVTEMADGVLRKKTTGQGNGLKAQWVYVKTDEVGVQPVSVSGSGKRYPIIEFQANWFGAYGNNLGVSLYAPTTLDRQPLNDVLVKDQLAFVYRLEIAERENEFSTPNLLRNNFGGGATDFTFKQNTFNRNLGNKELYAGTSLLDQYRNLNPGLGRQPEYGPFGELHVYDEAIEELVQRIYEKEIAVNPILKSLAKDSRTQQIYTKEEAGHLINFVSGRNPNGTEYYTYQVSPLVSAFDGVQGKVSMGPGNFVYGLGGNDGEMSFEQFDADVRKMLKNLGTSNESFHIEDMAEYPFKNFYDIGYSKETKETIFRLLSLRPDVNICMSPHDVCTKKTRAQLLEARGIEGTLLNLKMLNIRAMNYPESVIYGTSVCRAVAPINIGKVADGTYPFEVPATIEILDMRADYMGSGDGVYRSQRAYDTSPNNHMRVLKDVQHLFIPADIREQVWGAGGVYFQNKRRKVPFIAGLQTMYPDDTSILNSDITMQTVCELNRIIFEVWTELTGSAKYKTDAEFIQESNRLIVERTRNRFDNRYDVEPNTYFSGYDQARGYSWSCEIDLYGPNMRTVSKGTVITHRFSEKGGS